MVLRNTSELFWGKKVSWDFYNQILGKSGESRQEFLWLFFSKFEIRGKKVGPLPPTHTLGIKPGLHTCQAGALALNYTPWPPNSRFKKKLKSWMEAVCPGSGLLTLGLLGGEEDDPRLPGIISQFPVLRVCLVSRCWEPIDPGKGYHARHSECGHSLSLLFEGQSSHSQ